MSVTVRVCVCVLVHVDVRVHVRACVCVCVRVCVYQVAVEEIVTRRQKATKQACESFLCLNFRDFQVTVQ